MSQIDFLAIRMVADIIVTTYSTHMFTSNKRYDPATYSKETGVPECSFRSLDPSNLGPMARAILGPCLRFSSSKDPEQGAPLEEALIVYPMMPPEELKKTKKPMSNAGYTPRSRRHKHHGKRRKQQPLPCYYTPESRPPFADDVSLNECGFGNTRKKGECSTSSGSSSEEGSSTEEEDGNTTDDNATNLPAGASLK